MSTASAPRKQPAKRPANKRLAPVHAHPTAPAGRFAELMRDVHVPDPYVITEDLRVDPPSRNQMAQIQAAQASFAIANSQLQSMLEPVKQEKLGDDGKPEVDDQGEKVYIEVLPEIDPAHLEQIQSITQGASERYNRALFGDAYGQVIEYFDRKPVQVWNAFYVDIQNEFMPVPEDGRCPTCGHVEDQEQVGKPLASTSS
jgi:hypothetical protein